MIIYPDVSSYQKTIDWAAYVAWAKGQGHSQVIAAIKATEGVGFTDPSFVAHRQGALVAGVDLLIYYGFARPDIGNNPVDEANWLHSVVGTSLRSQDLIMLDIEVASTADWAYRWLVQQEANYGKQPVIYTYDNFARTHLQDSRLARFPLIIANYTYNPNARPPCPPPWTSYLAIQYTDKASIPGISGAVDANVYLGGTHMPIPTNWHDDGHTLTAPNGHRVVLGFRDHILSAPAWDAGNQPNEEEYHTDQVLLHNSSVGAGQRQTFRDDLLWYTAGKGVIQEPFLGLEIKAAYDTIASLQAEIARLQATAPPPVGNLSDVRAQLQIIQAAQEKALKDLSSL